MINSSSDNGFCDYERTISSFNVSYNWPETEAGSKAYLPCELLPGPAPFGIGTANAIRVCMPGGIWSDPDFSACRNSEQGHRYDWMLL